MADGPARSIWARLDRAMRSLAVSDLPLRERLQAAWDHELVHIRTEMEPFFPNNQDDVQRVCDGLDGRNGGAAVLQPGEAEDVARRIVSLYATATRRMEPLED